jgi:hypothetical protein
MLEALEARTIGNVNFSGFLKANYVLVFMVGRDFDDLRVYDSPKAGGVGQDCSCITQPQRVGVEVAVYIDLKLDMPGE